MLVTHAAASARLCVETYQDLSEYENQIAAASARLCVETSSAKEIAVTKPAAASARLCVETALSTEQYNRAQAEKQREDEIKKINSNFKYEIK